MGIKDLIEYFTENSTASLFDKIKKVWDFLAVIKDLAVAVFELAKEFGKGKSFGPIVYLTSSIVEFIKSLFSFVDSIKSYQAQQERFRKLKEHGEEKLKEMQDQTTQANCENNITNYEIGLDAVKLEKTLEQLQEYLPEQSEVSQSTSNQIFQVLKINPRFSLLTERIPGELKKFINEKQYNYLKNVSDFD